MARIGILSSNQQEALSLAALLKEQGYTIIPIPNTPKTTLLSLMKEKPDVILVELPRNPFQHLDIVQDIHYNKLLSTIPIIGFGTHTDHQMVKKFTSVGIVKYLLQPLRPKVLLHILETLIAARIRAEAPKNARVYTDNEENAMLLDSNVLAGLKIEHMVKKIDKLLSFPFTIAKFVELTADPKYAIDDLVEIIKLDPGLSATILKAANSVEFGSHTRVQDFKEAIIRIGFEVTQNIVLSVKVMELLPSESNHAQFDRQDYWYHSICNAVIAEKIAKKIKFSKPGYAFLAGLLHDYPILLYDEYFGPSFDTVLHKSLTSFKSIENASREVLGFSPSEFIVELAHQWALPNEVINALRYHKSFIHLPSKLNRLEEKQLISIVGMSDILTKVIRFGKSVDEYIYPIPQETMELLKFNAGIPHSFIDSIPFQVERFCVMLGLPRKPYPVPCFARNDEPPPVSIIIQSRRTFFEPHIFFLEHSDIETTTLVTLEALKEKLDGDESIDFIFINELPGDLSDQFDPYLALIELYPPHVIIFKEPVSTLHIPEHYEPKILSKMIDIRFIIQEIDSLSIDLEDITR
ncbi:MAG: response regulator [Fibrobacterales bacterium]